MSERRELVGTILRVIQRTADTQGNVTMIRLAENIATELSGLDPLNPPTQVDPS